MLVPRRQAATIRCCIVDTADSGADRTRRRCRVLFYVGDAGGVLRSSSVNRIENDVAEGEQKIDAYGQGKQKVSELKVPFLKENRARKEGLSCQ